MKKILVIFILLVLLFTVYTRPFVEVVYGKKILLDGKKVWLIKEEADNDSIEALKSIELDDSNWMVIDAPIRIEKIKDKDGKFLFNKYSEVVWYRLHLQFPKHIPEHTLAIRAGIIFDSNEVYFNGHLIGRDGSITPLKHAYDKKRIYEIPSKYIIKGGDNVLSIRIKTYFKKGGIARDTIYLDTYFNILKALIIEEFNQVLFVVMYFIVAIYFLLFFIRRPKSSENLFFGLFSFFIAIYFFLRSNIKYMISDNFNLMKKLEYLVLFLFIAILLEFFIRFFKRKHHIIHYIFYGISLLSFIIVIFTKDPRYWDWVNMRVIQPSWLLGVGSMIYIAINEGFWKGNRDGKLIFLTFAILLLGFANDILVERDFYNFVRVSPYLVVFLVGSMALILANRFVRLHSEVEALNIELEKKVKKRTKQLNVALDELKEKDARLQQELKMAGKIQQGLLPDNIPQMNGVRIIERYMPLQAVGGDFYDVFYMKDGRFGIMIADVSGHGVPAALITTIAKRSFDKASLVYNEPKDIFREVNTDICEMVATQEYLTCFFVAIDPDKTITCANAAHQKAIIVSPSQKKIDQIDTNGMFIGAILEANNTYEQVSFKVNKDDKILLFTDCLVEAVNMDHQQYTVNSLLASIQRHINLKGELFVDAILNDFFAFIGDQERDDDLTLLLIEAV